MYSKIKLNLKVTDKNKFDQNKQIRSLMPNLIHSLDATSLSLLYAEFISHFSHEKMHTQFFSIHDCFGTTCEKVFVLKTILPSVYTNLYSSDPYLQKFYKNILDNIESNTHNRLDRKARCAYLRRANGELYKYDIHDVD